LFFILCELRVLCGEPLAVFYPKNADFSRGFFDDQRMDKDMRIWYNMSRYLKGQENEEGHRNSSGLAAGLRRF
jgi:hypothetical protein